jgi:hypothetical protein
MALGIALALCAALLSGCVPQRPAGAAALGAAAPGTAGARPYAHLFVIVEENIEFDSLVGNPQLPTLADLTNRYGLATHYFGLVHPSEGNYVALVGGDSYGISDDNLYTQHTIRSPSIVDQLETAGLSWRGYFQGLPGPGYGGECYPTAPGPCLYAAKHNGFLNFAHVQSSPDELRNIVPDTQLATDLASGQMANLVFITPDQCHDLHGLDGACSGDRLAQQTDDYLRTMLDLLMHSSLWSSERSAIVITADEGGTNLGCCGVDPGGGRVATIVIRSDQSAPQQDATPYNHVSLLATMQTAFGLGCRLNGAPIGRTCDTAAGVQPMRPLFGL